MCHLCGYLRPWKARFVSRGTSRAVGRRSPSNRHNGVLSAVPAKHVATRNPPRAREALSGPARRGDVLLRAHGGSKDG
eukprot:4817139-Alexandrium_andersonii.AAC.1